MLKVLLETKPNRLEVMKTGKFFRHKMQRLMSCQLSRMDLHSFWKVCFTCFCSFKRINMLDFCLVEGDGGFVECGRQKFSVILALVSPGKL